jgi:hypothetical protein
MRTLSKRYLNKLLAVLKDHKEGSIKDLDKLAARFAIEEGLTLKKVKLYLEHLSQQGHLVIESDNWHYT